MKTNSILNYGFPGSFIIALLLSCQLSSYGQTYCTPTYTYDDCSSGDIISNVTLDGETININNTTGCGLSNNYSDYTALNHPDLIQGNTYDISIATTYGSPSFEDVRAWIDYDNDGTFSSSEEIAYTNGNGLGSSGSSTFSFTVPGSASTGQRRMRVRMIYSASTIDPCSNGTWGETEDYTVNIIPLAPPNNAGVDSLINPQEDGNFCSGQQLVKVRLSNLGQNPLNSVNLDWSVDGVMQTGQSFTFNPPVNSISSPNHDTVITLGYVTFPYQTGVHIKAWTSNPNGVSDTDPTDDTLDMTIVSNIQGVATQIEPQDTVICAGTSVILDAGQQPAGCIFIWSNGAITRQTAVNQPGDYSVIVQSLGGCFAYDTVTITQHPQPIAGDFGVVDLGSGNFQFTPINMENITNYHWDFGDGDSLDVGSDMYQTHHYTQTGTYAVSLTVSNACGAITLSQQIYVQPATGIGDVESLEQAVKVYPNPARDKVKIVLPDNIRINKIVVYNVIGQKVYESTVENGYVAEIDLKSIGSGVYNIQVYTESGVATKKLNVLK